MIHIAVLLKPYLDMLLDGRKSIECRLTRQPRAPFDAIEAGERIYFKQSAGPYRATAIAEHVLCESGLTPARVSQLKRDYNDQIRGDSFFWKAKRDSLYATLIWLRDLEAVEVGPAIRPLQGLAWLTLSGPTRRNARPQDAPAIRASPRPSAPAGCFDVRLTPGNLKNNTLYVSSVIDRFPPTALGGATRRQAAKPMTLILDGDLMIHSDIVAARGMLRSRVWGPWFRRHEARAGDRVVFTPAGDATYFVGLKRSRA